MKLNIAHKIFGIALVVLTLMAAVAVYSVKLTAEISDELDDVAGTQLPLSDSIGRINVRILEQGQETFDFGGLIIYLLRCLSMQDVSTRPVKPGSTVLSLSSAAERLRCTSAVSALAFSTAALALSRTAGAS